MKINKEDLYALKNNKNIYFFIGFLCKTCFSKEIFPKNAELNKFLFKEYKITLKKYTLSSRTLMIALAIKHILKTGYEEKMTTKLFNYLLMRESKTDKIDVGKIIKNRDLDISSTSLWVSQILKNGEK